MSEHTEALQSRLSLLVPINNLDPQQRDQVLENAEILEFRNRDLIFRQGERDDWSYYVLDGEVEMVADEQLIKNVIGGEGASFHALAQLQPRQMSARARSGVRILRVDRGLIDRLLSANIAPAPNEPAIEVTEIETTASGNWLTEMLRSELFARIPPANIQNLLDTLETVAFRAGEVVVEQDAPGDYYYAIQSGQCEVTRATKNGRSIKLAELGPGARFGEEALVSNAKRNATVRMLADGELARLTKEDFVELIQKPVLSTCTLDEARNLISDGAIWLDVRFPEEHRADGLGGSVNIPLSNLRGSRKDLDKDQRYIAYCDTGGRSSAAAFLLTQDGFNVSHIDGGAIDEVPESVSATPKSTSPPTHPENLTAQVSKEQSQIIEAEIRAQSLAADLEKAKLQIELANKIMAEAEAAKADADRQVAHKLHAEREKVKQQAATVQSRMQQALRLKNEIERQQIGAANEAQRRIAEERKRTESAQQQADARLQREEQRIEALYREQAEKLEQLDHDREASAKELEQAWQAIETEATLSKERMAAAKELEQELLEQEQRRARELQAHEDEMRAGLQTELQNERQKLESEFAKNAEQMARVRRERESAAAAKLAAAEEAQRIVEEYKQSQERHHTAQNEKLIEQQQQIEADAARLTEQLEKAAKSRAQAEDFKRRAEMELAETRSKQRANEDTDSALRKQLAMIETRAKEASERLKAAVRAENSAQIERRENAQRLKSHQSDNEMNLLLEQDLDTWVAEQDRILNSTARREEIEKQLRQTERIKNSALLAQRDTVSHDRDLLDEMAAQLNESSSDEQ